MITVHHLIVGRSLFTVWLLEELGLEYELELYERLPTRRAPDALKKIHPLGKSPVIVDDGRVIHESGAEMYPTHGSRYYWAIVARSDLSFPQARGNPAWGTLRHAKFHGPGIRGSGRSVPAQGESQDSSSWVMNR